MAGTPTGAITLQSTMQIQLAAGGNVLAPYNVPVTPTQTHTYSGGTGALQINKIAQLGGSAAASPVSTDLTTVTCVDGSTGFSHVREMIVFNDDPTNDLLWDFTATNALIAMFNAGGASAKVAIKPGAHQRFSVPNGTNGYTVDSTHKVLKLDPGANTIAYRAMIMGD